MSWKRNTGSTVGCIIHQPFSSWKMCFEFQRSWILCRLGLSPPQSCGMLVEFCLPPLERRLQESWDTYICSFGDSTLQLSLFPHAPQNRSLGRLLLAFLWMVERIQAGECHPCEGLSLSILAMSLLVKGYWIRWLLKPQSNSHPLILLAWIYKLNTTKSRHLKGQPQFSVALLFLFNPHWGHA